MELLAAGILLGLSAGLTPGPLLALVVSQSLRHGFVEGLKVALTPLVTDTFIILICLLILSRWSGHQSVLGLLSLAGGCFVAWLGLEGFRARGIPVLPPAQAPRSLVKGTLVNLLSPHPYLFWLMVGVPLLIQGQAQGPGTVVAFLAGFFVCLVGAKILVAWLAARSRGLFQGQAYAWAMRVLGALLLGFAVLLARDGLRLLGLLARAGGAAALLVVLAGQPLWAAELESALIWRFPDEKQAPALVRDFRACLDRGQGVVPCLRRIMRATGASSQALAAARLAQGEAYVSQYTPMGDLGLAVLTYPARANTNNVPCILGGRPAMVSTEFSATDLDLSADPEFPAIRARFPQAELWTVEPEFLAREGEPGGGQRFVFAYPLLDGCHACERAGTARVAHVFDRRKVYQGPRLLGLTPAP